MSNTALTTTHYYSILIISKCDREQPICGRCQSLNLDCEYAIGPSDTSRKAALQRQLGEVEIERNDLRDLLDLIQTQPDDEAAEIFRRLRKSRDPLVTLRSIRQARLLLPNPDPVAQFHGYPQIERLDAECARWNPLKLRARPWTTVAGDGIVSALLSKFFAWDGAYMLPLVDSLCFIRDLKTGDVARSEFCSPFLVSAICTLQVSQVRAFVAAKPETLMQQIRTLLGWIACMCHDVHEGLLTSVDSP